MLQAKRQCEVCFRCDPTEGAADLDVDIVCAIGACVPARACPDATKRWWSPPALAQLFGLHDSDQARGTRGSDWRLPSTAE
jgi:hypothetical protein